LAPFPEAGAVAHFSILGGTDDFRKAHGDATLVVLSNGDIDNFLALSNHTRDSTNFLKLSFMARQPG
jgi:hypothetical protein